MKKAFAITVVLSLFICFCSCQPEREIKSITIGENTYSSVYLCSFTNADINYEYTAINQTDLKPSSDGYVFITNKNNKTAEVWEQFVFCRQPDAASYSSADITILADVTEIIEQYPIQVESQGDSYVITYYTFSHKTNSEKERLTDSLSKHVVKTAKENVVMVYYE